MSDDQLNQTFKTIVPDAPDPEGWANGARQRRRHHSQLMAGAVGVVALALAVPVGINLANRNIVATPAQAPEQTAVSIDPATGGRTGAAACYGTDGEPLQVTQGDGVKPGAVRAWLCGDGNTVGPLEPLATDVDRIVEFVTKQDKLPEGQPCTMEYRLAYNVVLEYADGTRKPVMGELHGCKTINDGAVVRAGGLEFYNYVRGLWQKQRVDAKAPEGLPAATCPARPTMLVPPLESITAGMVCDLSDLDGSVLGQTAISPEDAARIAADIKANAKQGEAGGWAGMGPTLSLSNSWGDVMILGPNEGARGYWFMDADDVTWVWTPSAEVQELLNGIPMPIDARPTGKASPGDPVATDR